MKVFAGLAGKESKLIHRMIIIGLLGVMIGIGGNGWTLERDADPGLKAAWSAWRNGEIAEAERLAGAQPRTDEGRHLLLLCAFVQGKYEAALSYDQEISPSYPRSDELNEPVAMAYFHLGRYAEAGRFAQEHKITGSPENIDDALLDFILVTADHPLKVSLDRVTIIPFAREISANYFPPFPAEINDQKITVHLDTGGSFLYMGPKQAKKLGIEALRCSPVFFNTGKGYRSNYEMCSGIARTFHLGDALLENVPVTIIPTLDLPINYAIFGASVFEQFLTTMDYPAKRLILSPRNNPELRRKHLEMLPQDTVEFPFYLWGVHLMFAKGGVGRDQNLNFVVDTGLVDFRWDKKLRLRQAAFIAPKEKYIKWSGAPVSNREKQHFEGSLSLGPLEQDDCIITLERPGLTLMGDLGGVRIDGFISHGFIKNYSWTLDFNERKYFFH